MQSPRAHSVFTYTRTGRHTYAAQGMLTPAALTALLARGSGVSRFSQTTTMTMIAGSTILHTFQIVYIVWITSSHAYISRGITSSGNERKTLRCWARGYSLASGHNVRLSSSVSSGGYEREQSDNKGSRYIDTRLVGDSDAARELQGMQYEYDEQDDDYSHYSETSPERSPWTGDQYDEREDEDYAEDYDEEYADAGNFWSNPKRSLDSYPHEEPKPTPRTKRSMPPSTAVPHRRRRAPPSRRRSASRTTFRSGTPSPPSALKDFYDRLFWYGFDAEEMASTSDKTVFGGSRGKFNGIEYMKQVNGQPNVRPYRENREPRKQSHSVYAEDRLESSGMDDESENEEYFFEEKADVDSYRDWESGGRRESRDRDWIKDEVSSWFLPDSETSRREYNRRSGRSKKQSPWDAVNQLFRFDDDGEAKYKAEMYRRRLDVGSGRGRHRRDEAGRSTTYGGDEEASSRRRDGNAYRYFDMNYQSSSPSIVDVEVNDVADDTLDVEDDKVAENSDGSEAPDSIESDQSMQKPKRKWLDRAQAVERVPPSGVPAWGPSGDIGLDARTKATLDALEEIREAKRKIALRKEKVILAKENLILKRSDAELRKKRILSKGGSPRTEEQLQEIEIGVNDASIFLRLCKAQEAAAQDRLTELEDRHWALLSLYDADKAFREVVETIRESERTTNDSASSEKVTVNDKESVFDDEETQIDSVRHDSS